MNKYKYVLALEVEVEAFDIFDADEIIQDNFGEGDATGAHIVKMTIVDVND